MHLCVCDSRLKHEKPLRVQEFARWTDGSLFSPKPDFGFLKTADLANEAAVGVFDRNLW